MTAENPSFNQNAQEEKPPSLLDLVPVKIGEGVWAYQRGEGTEKQQFVIDSNGRIVATKQGEDVFLRKGGIGWIVTVEKSEEGGLLLLGSYGWGGKNITLGNVYVIDEGQGRVVSRSYPVSGTAVTLLKLNQQQSEAVLIPVAGTKRISGVIVTTTGELKKLQNIGRIRGFFITIKK